MQIHPQAIIFDYGQVLCLPQPLSDREIMAGLLQMPQADFDETYWRFRLAYDAALLEPAEYWNKVAKRDLPASDIARVTEIDNDSWIHSEPVMTEWARQLHAGGVRTAILSNMPLPVRERLDRVDWLPEFSHRTFSCDVRLAKPAPEIYQHCLQGLGVEAREALFLDDRPENIHAAEELGIHSILFSTAADLAEQLQSRFSIPVPLIAKVK